MGADGRISELLPPNADLLRLPSFDAVELDDKLVTIPDRLKIPLDDFRHLRRMVIRSAIMSFVPDVLWIDFLPMGKGGELKETITKFRESYTRSKIYLGVRDIIGQLPNNSKLFSTASLDFINKSYDAVLFSGDPSYVGYETDPFTPYALNLSGLLKIPMINTGYIVRQERPNNKKIIDLREELGAKNSPLVVVGAGGGRRAFDLYKSAILAKKYIRSECTTIMVVITGPYADEDELSALKAIAAEVGSIKVIEFVPNMLDFIAAADVFVGSAGYSSMAEMVVSRTPSIIVPRKELISQEQSLRAKMFSDLGLCQTIKWEDITPELIGNAISQAMLNDKQGKRTSNSLSMEGRRLTARLILESAL